MRRPRHLHRPELPLVAGVVIVVLLAALAALVALPPAPSASATGAEGAAVPDPVRPAFRPPRPRPIRHADHVSQWAPVLRAAAARSRPGRDAPVIASLGTRTPEGTANVVAVLDSSFDSARRLWVRVRLPILPNNSVGWVPRKALGGYARVRTKLVIDTGRLTATLYRDGAQVFSAPVGIGRAAWPTPFGRFYVRNKLTRFSDEFYGPLAFGTSARSAVLTDWPAGGFIGIHGTDQPELIPGRISHGCVRLRNEDIVRLARLMPVGTPIRIR